VLLLLLAGAVCGGSLYASTLLLDNVSPTIMYAAAGVGGALFAANMLGLVSVWSDNVRARALLMVRAFATAIATDAVSAPTGHLPKRGCRRSPCR